MNKSTLVISAASLGLWLAAPGSANAETTAESVSPLNYAGGAWSPYLVGGLIGLLSMFTFYFCNRPLGASTAYAKVSGLVAQGVAPEHTRSLKYFKDNPPKVGWELTLVIGIVLGAMLAAWTGGELTGRFLPQMWQDRFGSASYLLRTLVALIGGVLLAYGARMAGGCTSGHGISGTLQLSVGSWIAAIGFFLGGITTATLLFG